jgi:dienelactone hydrolase
MTRLTPLPDSAATGPPGSGPEIAGFAQFWFAHGDLAHVVYQAGERAAPPVLVLQELPGLAPGLLNFVRRLCDAGHQVYLPWLFGAVGQRQPLRNFARLCISREFGYLRDGVSAPVTDWLRALVRHISQHNDQRAISAIGMCLTGGFAIPLLLEPAVVRAVAAQPAIALSLRYLAFGHGGAARRAGLNVAQTHIDAARVRLASGAAQLLAVRCMADRLCPPEKMTRLQAEFPVGLTVRQYGQATDINALGERPHAIYTKEYRLATADALDHPAHVAFAELVAFLRAEVTE